MIDDEEENSFIEPKRFKIDIPGAKRNFVFETFNSELLREWKNALYANWHSS